MKYALSLLILVSFAVPLAVRAQESTGWTVTDIAVDAEVNEEGVLHVEETIRGRFIDLKRGIFRTIPHTFEIDDRRSLMVRVHVVDVLDARGRSVPYLLDTSLDATTLRIGDANNFTRGPFTYKILYELEGAVAEGDFDEVFLSFEEDWPLPSSGIRMTLSTPEGADIQHVVCQPSTCNVQTDNGVELTSNEYVKGTVRFSSDSFSGVASTVVNRTAALERMHAAKRKQQIIGLVTAGLVALIALAYLLFTRRFLVASVKDRRPVVAFPVLPHLSSLETFLLKRGALPRRFRNTLVTRWQDLNFVEVNGRRVTKKCDAGEGLSGVEAEMFLFLFRWKDRVGAFRLWKMARLYKVPLERQLIYRLTNDGFFAVRPQLLEKRLLALSILFAVAMILLGRLAAFETSSSIPFLGSLVLAALLLLTVFRPVRLSQKGLDALYAVRAYQRYKQTLITQQKFFSKHRL